MDSLVREDLFHRPRVNTVKAAEIAGVTTRTIYNWMRLGMIEYVRTPSGDVRIFADSLLRRGSDDAA
jgi:predicted site-specific integrase-resolvase